MTNNDALQQIRRKNARALFESHCDGVGRIFSDRIGRAQSLSSELLNGKRVIGERMARHIEEQFGQAFGSLDIDPEEVEKDPSVPVIDHDQVQFWLDNKPLTKQPKSAINIDGVDFPPRSYAVLNQDSSMEPRICAGDTVILAPECEPEIGDVIAVEIHKGIMTLGKLAFVGAKLVLQFTQGGPIELPADLSDIFRGKVSFVMFADY